MPLYQIARIPTWTYTRDEHGGQTFGFQAYGESVGFITLVTSELPPGASLEQREQVFAEAGGVWNAYMSGAFVPPGIEYYVASPCLLRIVYLLERASCTSSIRARSSLHCSFMASIVSSSAFMALFTRAHLPGGGMSVSISL